MVTQASDFPLRFFFTYHPASAIMSKSSDIRDQLVPNPDGEDNQRDETFFMQECLLGQVGMASMPEDAKLQLISYLKDKVFPFM